MLIPCSLSQVAGKLHEYSTGQFLACEFKGKIYEKIYNSHMATLESMEEQNPDAYHGLMRHLYKCAKSVILSLQVVATVAH